MRTTEMIQNVVLLRCTAKINVHNKLLLREPGTSAQRYIKTNG